MKTFGKILICLLLCVCTFGLCSCGNSTDKPDEFFQTKVTSYVSGNGGLAVESDGYLYFVNGFKTSASQEKQNDSYTVGSLKVTKLVNGQIVCDDNGNIKDSYLHTMSDKLTGFEASSLYVIGEYLYFTSPCQENEKGGDWAKERVDFNRIKLNNTGKVERIYQSNVNWGDLEFAYYTNGSSVYLMVAESENDVNKLYRINATSKNNEVDTICDNVASYKLGKNCDYTNGKYENGFVFYTTKNDNEVKFVLYNPISGNSSVEKTNDDINVLYVDNKSVYYTKANGDINELWLYSITGSSLNNRIRKLQYSGDKNFVFSDDGTVLSVDDKTISRVLYNGSVNKFTTPEESDSIKVLGVYNSWLIYAVGNNIKAVGCANGKVVSLSSVDNLDVTYFSFARGYIYTFATVNENEYLFRVSAIGGEANFVGCYDADDVPKAESEN